MKKLLVTTALLALSSQAFGYGNVTDDVDIEVISDRGHRYDIYPLRDSSQDTFRAYLEAVSQDNYQIRVRNRTSDRIGVVIAVDGRNIISGDKSKLSSNERMYVLAPYERATYSGWRTASDRINRFYFTDIEDSYSAAFGDYSAMGVIAAAAFREKYKPRPPQRWNKRDGWNRGDESLENDSAARSPNAAPQASEKGRRSLDEPGTGYGREEYSPSVRVEFKAERRAFASYFLKYEWRDTLCEKGIVNCHRRNRFWDDSQAQRFAPPPPTRRWHSRRHW